MKLAEEILKTLKVDEAKGIDLPGHMFELVSFGKDSNGNSVVKLKNGRGKGFSIQTNGNLPKVHSMKSGKKAKDLSPAELKDLGAEVKEYVAKHGTKLMKESVDEAKMTSKKAGKIFDKLYKVHGNRVQVDIMDLGKISGPVEKALMDGKSEEEAEEILKEMIAKHRKN